MKKERLLMLALLTPMLLASGCAVTPPKLAATVSCPGPDTAAVARGQAATRAAMVLSDLLARADKRTESLAEALDRARAAGRQCEREYDALTPPAQVSR